MIFMYVYVVILCILNKNVGGQIGYIANSIRNIECSFDRQNQNLKSDVGPRIIGGEDIPISSAPYQVAISMNNMHFCGGALISPSTVVTAAHCMEDKPVDDVIIRAGSTYRDVGGVVTSVLWFVNHPHYDPNTGDNDVSVLRLWYDLPICQNLYPIRLPRAWKIWLPQTPAIASGWGLRNENHTDDMASRKLQAVVLRVVEQGVCKRVFPNITYRMLCASSPNYNKDTCRGDSGGPLVIDEVLAGIISFGSGCARPGIPGVYTNVAMVKDFIEAAEYID